MKDRYVFGLSEHGVSYLVRLVVPRFAAQVRDAAESPDVAMEPGCRYVLRTGEMFCNVNWMDPVPGEELRQKVMGEAEEAWLYFASMYRR